MDSRDKAHRRALLTRLSWSHAQVNLEPLSTGELARIDSWVSQRIRVHHHCNVPGTSYVLKERRTGSTGRVGWRWVVYVGVVGSPHESTVHRTRTEARAARRKAHAHWWAEHVRCPFPTHASSRSRDSKGGA